VVLDTINSFNSLREEYYKLALSYEKYRIKWRDGGISPSKTYKILNICQQNLSTCREILVRSRTTTDSTQVTEENKKVKALFEKVVNGFKSIDDIPIDEAKDKKESIIRFMNELTKIIRDSESSLSDKERIYLKFVYYEKILTMSKILRSISEGNILVGDLEICRALLIVKKSKLPLSKFLKNEASGYLREEIERILELYENEAEWKKTFEPTVEDPLNDNSGEGGGGAARNHKALDPKERELIIEELLRGEAEERRHCQRKDPLHLKKTGKQKINKTNSQAPVSSPSNNPKKNPTFLEIVTQAIYSSVERTYPEAKRVKRWNNPDISATYVLKNPEIFPEYQKNDEMTIKYQIALHVGEKLNMILKNEELRIKYASKCPGGFKIKATLHVKDGHRGRDFEGFFELGVGKEDRRVYHRYFRRDVWGADIDHLFAENLENAIKGFEEGVEDGCSSNDEEETFEEIGNTSITISKGNRITFNLLKHPFVTGYTIYPTAAL
jgi:hypothetical protein